MIYTNSDGGSRGNPGKGAIGFLVRKEESIMELYGEKIGIVTNNEAEYMALIRAMQLASTYTKDELTCVMDSELVVKQLMGEYQIKNARLLKLFMNVQKLQENFEKISYVHVSRNDKFQKMVDAVLNMEMDKQN